MRFSQGEIPLTMTDKDTLHLDGARVTWRRSGAFGLVRLVRGSGRMALEAPLVPGETRLVEAGGEVFELQAGDEVLLVERA